MLKRIQRVLKKRAIKKEQQKELDKMKAFYQKIQAGALCIEYIYKDIEKKKKTMNRHQRRRYENSLKKNGKFSVEIIEEYKKQAEAMVEYITNELAKKIK